MSVDGHFRCGAVRRLRGVERALDGLEHCSLAYPTKKAAQMGGRVVFREVRPDQVSIHVPARRDDTPLERPRVGPKENPRRAEAAGGLTPAPNPQPEAPKDRTSKLSARRGRAAGVQSYRGRNRARRPGGRQALGGSRPVDDPGRLGAGRLWMPGRKSTSPRRPAATGPAEATSLSP